MSFSSDVKSELCRLGVSKLCCARSEAYGVLLCCSTFTAREVRIVTESADFAARLPKLFQRSFGVAFDRLPEAERALFSLRAFAGYNATELGELFDLSPSTVRCRLASARRKLVSWYQENN